MLKPAKPTAKITRYVVLHSAVGKWSQGHILHVDELPIGAEIDRLLELGAVGIAPDEIALPVPHATKEVHTDE